MSFSRRRIIGWILLIVSIALLFYCVWDFYCLWDSVRSVSKTSIEKKEGVVITRTHSIFLSWTSYRVKEGIGVENRISTPYYQGWKKIPDSSFVYVVDAGSDSQCTGRSDEVWFWWKNGVIHVYGNGEVIYYNKGRYEKINSRGEVELLRRKAWEYWEKYVS